MRANFIAIASAFLVSAGLALAGIVDVELSVTPDGYGAVTNVTARLPAGHIESIAVDLSAGATGYVSVAVGDKAERMSERAVVATNNIANDLWVYPSQATGLRYAVSDTDFARLIVTNLAVPTNIYRAVIRVDTTR